MWCRVVGRRAFSVLSARRAAVLSAADVPVIYVSRMKNILEANRIAVSDGFACLGVSACPVGCPQRPQGEFFINKTTGQFVCHACGKTGPWLWLERRLMDKKRGETAPVFPAESDSNLGGTSSQPVPIPNDIWTKCTPASTVPDKVLRECLSHLKLKYIRREVLACLGAMVGPSDLLLPLRGPRLEIGAWKRLSTPLAKSERPEETLHCSSKTAGQLLLANEEAWQEERVALVASAADLLALSAQRVPAICLEAQLLPQEVLPRLERFSDITLWFGQHQLQAKRIARKLGLNRCKIIRLSESKGGPHEELLASKEKGLRLSEKLDNAERMTHPAIVSFGSLRAEVLDAITRKDKNRGVAWQRFPQLTDVLGGFRDGELTILTGPTGSGKTTFLSEYSLDLCQQGVSTLWGSFEIRNTRLAKTMLTQLAGVSLEANLSRFDEFADKMEQLPLHFLDFHGQQPLRTVMNAVNHAQYLYDVGHVIIDNVQFMLGLGDSENKFIDRFYRQDQVIQAFRSFATQTNCHVTLVIHPRKESDMVDLTANSIFGSAKASQEADNILIIQTGMSAVTNAKQRKYLQVAKNRYTGDLGMVQLDFNKENLSFVRKPKPVVQKNESQINLTEQQPKKEIPPFKVNQVKTPHEFETFLNSIARNPK